MDFIDEKIETYAREHTENDGALLQALTKETHANLELPQMLTGRIEGRFLKLLARLVGARRILEIGTFSGYSALSMAEGLPDDGELFTCDVDSVTCAVARRYFEQSPHGKKITLMEGEALDSIAKLSGPFDMAFIDADKTNYGNYYDSILPLMRPGGLIAVDNVLWSGRVLTPEEESDHAIAAFNEKIKNDDAVEAVMLTVRDGIFCIRKK